LRIQPPPIPGRDELSQFLERFFPAFFPAFLPTFLATPITGPLPDHRSDYHVSYLHDDGGPDDRSRRRLGYLFDDYRHDFVPGVNVAHRHRRPGSNCGQRQRAYAEYTKEPLECPKRDARNTKSWF
jgi:hypothetical protein